MTKKDKETLIKLQNPIDTSKDKSPRIVENYKFFFEKLKIMDLDTIYKGIQKLFVVDVSLERDKDNPQLIFESMNSTGLELTQADLIRNYVLMGLEPTIQAKLYRDYWYPMEQDFDHEYKTKFDAFVRDYLTIKNKGVIPKQNAIYEAFKKYFVEMIQSGSKVDDIIEELYTNSTYYVKIALLKEENKKLLKKFKNIYTLKVNVAYPFLLELYILFKNDKIYEYEFLQIIDIVETYVFRRAICGIPTNSLNKTFANFMKKINIDDIANSIKAHFVLFDSYQRFPKDTEFLQSFIDKDIYSLRNRNYLLDKLENYDRKEIVNISDYTIEHIMPQNKNMPDIWRQELGDNYDEIHKRYLHTIGNLTLTGYNSELSDKSFSDKMTMDGGFENSPISLNKSVVQIGKEGKKWDKSAIKKRTSFLAKKAQEIWSYPTVSNDMLNKYSPKQEQNNTYSLQSYNHMCDNTLELYKPLEQRILNLDSSVKREFKKLYIAFKSITNFIDIVPQASGLRLSLNIDYDELDDPENLCKDIKDIGRWGNGDVEFKLENINQIEYAISLIGQALDKQIGNNEFL